MIALGMDVGREHDPAALAVLHGQYRRPGSHRLAWRLLEIGNLPLGTDYLDLATQIADLATDFTTAGYSTVTSIDATGIGAAVLELARGQAPAEQIYGVTITGGHSLGTQSATDFTVGKHRLTEVLQVALEQEGLTFDEHADPDGIAAFRRQLAQFRSSPSRTGSYQRHEAARGHDDLVLAAELALWTGDAMADEAAGIRP